MKICTMANHPHDNVRMLELTRQSKTPTIGLCMGDIGTPTRILAGKFGAAVHLRHVPSRAGAGPRPAQLQQMTEIYHYDQINAETEVYGVMADPVGHSLSPQVHNVGLPPLRLNKVYIPFPRAARGPGAVHGRRPGVGIRGLSVTIPHKEDVVKQLTEADGAVRGIGAANTVVFEDQAAAGLQHRLSRGDGQPRRGLGGAEGRRAPLAGQTALVLGRRRGGPAWSSG